MPVKHICSHITKEAAGIRLLLLFIALCCSNSCDRSDESIVPSYPVFIELRTDNTASALVSPGGYMIFTKISNEAKAIGYGGVLIIRGVTEQNEIYAYDLTCPVENKQSVKLTIQDGIKLHCSKCGSEFGNILYGNPVASAGQAMEQKRTLRRYAAYYSGNTITVHN